MVSYSFYEADNRVRRYAESLVRHGYHVDAISIRGDGQSEREVIDGVNVFRIQRRVRSEKGRLAYLYKLLLFFLRSMYFLTRQQVENRYDLIHVHSVPDFEVFSTLFAKMTGSRIILDIHDIVPEFYASKFDVSHDSLIFKMLVGVERMSAAFSDHVIAANHIWGKRLERSVKENKLTTILNFPDGKFFGRHRKDRADGKFIMIYPGTISYHQGVDLAIEAFSLIKDLVPEAEFHIYGSGTELKALQTQIVGLGLQERVFIKAPVTIDEIPAVIEKADLGVVPKRNNSFGNEAFSTKILEFMAMGLPVIIPDTAVDTFYFNDSIAKFFHANNVKSLADAMLCVIKNKELREHLAGNASEFVKQYTWDLNQAVYLDLVDSLVSNHRK